MVVQARTSLPVRETLLPPRLLSRARRHSHPGGVSPAAFEQACASGQEISAAGGDPVYTGRHLSSDYRYRRNLIADHHSPLFGCNMLAMVRFTLLAQKLKMADSSAKGVRITGLNLVVLRLPG